MPEHVKPVNLTLSIRSSDESRSAAAEERFLDLARLFSDALPEQRVSRREQTEVSKKKVAHPARYQEAIKVFANAEQSTVNLEVKRRPSQVRHEGKKEGLRAEVQLLNRLKGAGVVIASGRRGADLTISPAPEGFDFDKLTRQMARQGTLVSVPRPPRSAWNPDRPISRLLKAQVEHACAAEKGLPLKYQTGTYVNAIRTEGEAARYIRNVTEAIRDAYEYAEKGQKSAPHSKPLIEIAACADGAAERKRMKKKKSKIRRRAEVHTYSVPRRALRK